MVIWMEHMIMFAMLKVDKMLISMLPVGEENIYLASSINYSIHDIFFENMISVSYQESIP